MTENWGKAIKFVLDKEGGYSNDSSDPGGETKFGISKRAYPNLNIADLTIDQAKEIYKEDYWDRLKCDALPYPLDIIHFDTAVNLGVSRAITFKAMVDTWQDYLFLRLDWYTRLSTAKLYLRGWAKRVLDLWRLCNAEKT